MQQLYSIQCGSDSSVSQEQLASVQCLNVPDGGPGCENHHSLSLSDALKSVSRRDLKLM